MTVSWNWGSGQPGGTVAETKTEGELAITSKRGNKIKKNADPKNPAVHVERSGNDVVKKASELNVEEKANGTSESAGGSGETENKNGEKRKIDEVDAEDKKKEETKDSGAPLEENAEGKTVKATENGNKRQKKDDADDDDEEPKQEKKKAGRPKKAEGASGKAKKDPTPRSTDGIGSRTRSRQKA